MIDNASMVRIAIAGDTMLGRLCRDTVASGDPAAAFSDEIRAVVSEADLFLANLECCISDRGERWPDPRKPFFFRAPPAAATLLAELGVDVVTLANNHALDYGTEALLDTVEHLHAAGIGVVGAGVDVRAARTAITVEAGGVRAAIIALTDHPLDYAAGRTSPGVAYADLAAGVPDWVSTLVEDAEADIVIVTPHWGPNMTSTPVPHVRAAAETLVGQGVTAVAGHSAHVFHGVAWRGQTCLLYDLGDFYDDYAVDPLLRNDLGVLWTLHVDGAQPVAVDALPLRLDTCRTVVATGDDARWIAQRLHDACASFGTVVERPAGERFLRCRPAAVA